jgi:hypothetical protein
MAAKMDGYWVDRWESHLATMKVALTAFPWVRLKADPLEDQWVVL